MGCQRGPLVLSVCRGSERRVRTRGRGRSARNGHGESHLKLARGSAEGILLNERLLELLLLRLEHLDRALQVALLLPGVGLVLLLDDVLASAAGCGHRRRRVRTESLHPQPGLAGWGLRQHGRKGVGATRTGQGAAAESAAAAVLGVERIDLVLDPLALVGQKEREDIAHSDEWR